jgi:GNAT superfamily N-acetyltransferase
VILKYTFHIANILKTSRFDEELMEWQKDQYSINTDKSKLDLQMIHHFLYTTAYWATGRPMDIVRKSIENSLCFGVYDRAMQVGFARMVTDAATVGWLCDVFILPSHRGRGLGRWLVECIMDHPDVRGLRRILLNTRDAHELYEKYAGFRSMRAPESWMEKFTETPFRKAKPAGGSKEE